MAANGITLKPIRMGDLVSQDAAAKKTSGAYVPPNRRVGGAEPPVVHKKLDLSDQSFPALGVIPKKLPSWGKHVVAKVEVEPTKVEPAPEAAAKPKVETLSDKIQEKMRLSAISGQLSSVKETDPFKMSDAELAANGWTRLRLDRAKEIAATGFVDTVNPYLPGYIAEADSGMSFEEYMHYKGVKPAVSPYRQPAPSLASEDECYSDYEE